ncbi:protein of unknown function [Clostridium cavendishii DSM 21758]|uniref:DUF1836 domain-containing protein n=1 Tax=Clostridium cavendishii DSM 21758 TaxID=1121302 RepID=A0A1M6CVA7_9CLOT|nr:DUF1836 domain-containing protein [Clostridium cavendishii]SHI64889.1 protein of unknown function [Clostridium cavendishii DSM 21758]
MDIKNLDIFIDELKLDENITLSEIPEIDLYMDQVIQLFENKLSSSKRGDEDKILTKTMINNYAKGKLLMPIKNKKYTKEHIILMSLIYNLKGALSITDIKTLLSGVIENYENAEEKDINLNKIYKMYLASSSNNTEVFKENIKNEINIIEDKFKSSDEIFGEYEKNLLLVCSLINMSNMYRKVAEKIIDNGIKF